MLGRWQGNSMTRQARFIQTIVVANLLVSPLGVISAEKERNDERVSQNAPISESDWITRITRSDQKNLQRTLVQLQNSLIDRPRTVYPLLEKHLHLHLQSEQEVISRAAGRVLAIIGTADSLTIINRLLKESENEKQISLVWTLGEIGSEESVPVLVALLKTDSLALKKQVLVALRQIRSRDAVEPLIEVLRDDPHGTARAYAIEALGEVLDDRTVAALISLMGRWPVPLEAESKQEMIAWGERLDGTPFRATTQFNPREYYLKYMVPNVIVPALRRLTNHQLPDHESWAKWWAARRSNGIEAAYLAGFTGYSVQLNDASVPVLIQILEDESLPRYKRVNAQTTLSRLLEREDWDKSDFKPKKWAAEWRRIDETTKSAEQDGGGQPATHPELK
jgi:hypothetical protein